jgi:hypothetical protein
MNCDGNIRKLEKSLIGRHLRHLGNFAHFIQLPQMNNVLYHLDRGFRNRYIGYTI